MKPEFKKGDKVKCIENWPGPPEYNLNLSLTYTVTSYSSKHSTLDITHKDLPHTQLLKGHAPSRFKVIPPKIEAYQIY